MLSSVEEPRRTPRGLKSLSGTQFQSRLVRRVGFMQRMLRRDPLFVYTQSHGMACARLDHFRKRGHRMSLVEHISRSRTIRPRIYRSQKDRPQKINVQQCNVGIFWSIDLVCLFFEYFFKIHLEFQTILQRFCEDIFPLAAF